MITGSDFRRIVAALGDVAKADIAWANRCGPPPTAVEFALETIYVICNSGMKHTVARGIYDRVVAQIKSGGDAIHVFKHKGKAGAIDRIWRDRALLHRGFKMLPTDRDRLDYLRGLPWIGSITCYHLAKNFGAQVAKPDVHLQRLARREGTTPQLMCERIAKATGYRVPAVDTALWRACATGIIDSRTGRIK
jgi:hypothetical protein